MATTPFLSAPICVQVRSLNPKASQPVKVYPWRVFALGKKVAAARNSVAALESAFGILYHSSIQECHNLDSRTILLGAEGFCARSLRDVLFVSPENCVVVVAVIRHV